MRVHRLFVIDWIPDQTLSPEHPAVRWGVVKVPKKGIQFDCVCVDEDHLVGWDSVEDRISSPMWLCDGSSHILSCGLTTVDSLVGESFDAPEEEQARERLDAIWRATNRHEFDLHQEYSVTPRAVFLDRDEPGDTFCQPLQVEMNVETYAEIPDHVARMALLRQLSVPASRRLCDAAIETAIEAPSWLPVEVSTEAGGESTPGVLELVRSRPHDSRGFDARIYTQHHLRLSIGDLCRRTVRWTADGDEKQLSAVICNAV